MAWTILMNVGKKDECVHRESFAQLCIGWYMHRYWLWVVDHILFNDWNVGSLSSHWSYLGWACFCEKRLRSPSLCFQTRICNIVLVHSSNLTSTMYRPIDHGSQGGGTLGLCKPMNKRKVFAQEYSHQEACAPSMMQRHLRMWNHIKPEYRVLWSFLHAGCSSCTKRIKSDLLSLVPV
jgi:hypothetical protein